MRAQVDWSSNACSCSQQASCLPSALPLAAQYSPLGVGAVFVSVFVFRGLYFLSTIYTCLQHERWFLLQMMIADQYACIEHGAHFVCLFTQSSQFRTMMLDAVS